MILILLAIVAIILIFIMIKNKIALDINSFFRKSIPLDRGVFGVYTFTGKQGTGKTYSLNKFIRKYPEKRKIYSNVTLKGIEYIHLNTLDELLDLRDKKNVLIIYDEIFTLLSKTRQLPRGYGDKMEEFLTQQRKMKNIFITTAQEWLNIPIEFRRFVRIQIECQTIPLGALGGLLIETYYDATNMEWSNIHNEYVAPLKSTKISKYEKRFMETYNTYERIRPLQADSAISARNARG